MPRQVPLAALLLAAVAAAAPARAQPEAPTTAPDPTQQGVVLGRPGATPKRPAIYDEKADGQQQVAAALAKAKKENRRVLIQWGANWCSWCHLLHDCFTQHPEVKKKLAYEYDLVLLDIGRHDKHTDLAAKYGADLKKNGVPFLTVLDADGNVLANQETGSLEVVPSEAAPTPAHDPKKVLDFLTKHQASYPQAEAVIQAGLTQAKGSGKNVLLHFGAPWCGWCHKLEAWMARPEIAPILAKDFIDVKIDQDRTLGAEAVLKRYNPIAKGGIPWMVILSPEGQPLATSNGPEGNIGFPAAPQEIKHFAAMLNASKKSLTDADITALEASLTAIAAPPRK